MFAETINRSFTFPYTSLSPEEANGKNEEIKDHMIREKQMPVNLQELNRPEKEDVRVREISGPGSYLLPWCCSSK